MTPLTNKNEPRHTKNRGLSLILVSHVIKMNENVLCDIFIYNTYINMYICMSIYISLSLCTSVYIYTYSYIFVYARTYIYMHIHVYIHTYTYKYIYVYIHICKYICTCIYIYIRYAYNEYLLSYLLHFFIFFDLKPTHPLLRMYTYVYI